MLKKHGEQDHTMTPYHRKRVIEDCLRARAFTAEELAERARVSNRQVRRIIDELSCFLHVIREPENRYRIC